MLILLNGNLCFPRLRYFLLHTLLHIRYIFLSFHQKRSLFPDVFFPTASLDYLRSFSSFHDYYFSLIDFLYYFTSLFWHIFTLLSFVMFYHTCLLLFPPFLSLLFSLITLLILSLPLLFFVFCNSCCFLP